MKETINIKKELHFADELERRRMYHSSEMYDTQQSFEAIKSPFNIVSPLQISSPSTSCTSFRQNEHEPQHHQIYNNKLQQDPPNSQFSFTNSLHSIVESFLSSSEESFSSSERYSGFPSDNSHKYSDFPHYNFPQENNLLASDEKKPLEISFQRNQCSGACGIACVPFASRSSSLRKRRIRWTKDLHDLFIMIVNRLGGPEKAKPKSILEMMDSDVLTISHVKSHLQKYRSTKHMRKSLQERSEEGNRPDGVTELQLKINEQIEESRQLQLEVQKSLHEQLEMQQNLQLLIKQQRKQLKIMLDQQRQRSKEKVCVPE